MNQEDERTQKLLKQALPAVREELREDLWPKMLDRLARPPVAAVPWFDWALIAAVVLLLVLAPRSIPLLLYHL